jgi:hypothetical protein
LRRITHPLFIFMFVAAISSCAAPAQQAPAVATASGHPEVTLAGVTPGQAESQLMDMCSSALRGSVSTANATELDCTNLPSLGVGEALYVSMGEPEGGSSDDTARFDLGGGVRIIATRQITIRNAAGGEVTSHDLPAFNARLQQVLDSVH